MNDDLEAEIEQLLFDQLGCSGIEFTSYREVASKIMELLPKWRPIDTAPKDGTPVLIYEPGTAPQLGLQMVVARYEPGPLPEYC